MTTYILTGATGAIGRAVALALAHRGDEVITAGRGVSRLAGLAGIYPFEADLSTPGAAEQAIRDAASLRPVGGIIHCAGSELLAPIRYTRDDAWERAMWAASCALGLLRAASRRGVVADGGAVVLMSSASVRRAAAGCGAYAAGKAAVEALARTAAVELAPRGIRVSCVAPGAVLGPMHDRVCTRMGEENARAFEARHPLGICTPADVADAVLYLLDAPRVTGAVLPVDGGLTC